MGRVVEVGTDMRSLRAYRFCRPQREFQLCFLIDISLPCCRKGMCPLLDGSKLCVSSQRTIKGIFELLCKNMKGTATLHGSEHLLCTALYGAQILALQQPVCY